MRQRPFGVREPMASVMENTSRQPCGLREARHTAENLCRTEGPFLSRTSRRDQAPASDAHSIVGRPPVPGNREYHQRHRPRQILFATAEGQLLGTGRGRQATGSARARLGLAACSGDRREKPWSYAQSIEAPRDQNAQGHKFDHEWSPPD